MKKFKAKDFNDAYLELIYGSGRRDTKYINWKNMKYQFIAGTFPLWGLGGLFLIVWVTR